MSISRRDVLAGAAGLLSGLGQQAWAQAQIERISRDAAEGGSGGGSGGGASAGRAPDPVYGDEEPF